MILMVFHIPEKAGSQNIISLSDSVKTTLSRQRRTFETASAIHSKFIFPKI